MKKKNGEKLKIYEIMKFQIYIQKEDNENDIQKNEKKLKNEEINNNNQDNNNSLSEKVDENNNNKDKNDSISKKEKILDKGDNLKFEKKRRRRKRRKG